MAEYVHSLSAVLAIHSESPDLEVAEVAVVEFRLGACRTCWTVLALVAAAVAAVGGAERQLRLLKLK
jgi:hypothetical protein